MKNQEQILKELSQYGKRNKELIREIKLEVKNLPEQHSIGRLTNLINELNEINFKCEILKSVLI